MEERPDTELEDNLKNMTLHIPDCGMAHFLQSTIKNLPLTNFSLEVHSPNAYKTADFIQFRNHFGAEIKKLFVSSMFECQVNSEYSFFKSLINLKYLEIDKLIREDEDDDEPPRVPKIWFQTLQTQKVHTSINTDYHWLIVSNMRRKLSIKLPRILHIKSNGNATHEPRNHSAMLQSAFYRPMCQKTFQSVSHLITNYSKKLTTKSMELDLNRDPIVAGVYFLNQSRDRKLIAAIHKIDKKPNLTLRLLNVRTDMLDRIERTYDPALTQSFANSIVSIHGTSEVLNQIQLPNLEEISCFDEHNELIKAIRAQDPIDFHCYDCIEEIPGGWPKLRKFCWAFRITEEDSNDKTALNLLNVFFRKESRPSVQEMDLQIEYDPLHEPLDIFNNFPNLKRLKLVLDAFSQSQLSSLFLSLGKEVESLHTLDLTTPSVEEKAFFGSQPSNKPVFLEMKRKES
jgi:hypothetical protein